MTRTIILIKHSRPQVEQGIPSHRWKLSDEGRAKCADLAQRLRPHDPGRIITSEEPKAVETGQLVAGALNLPVSSAPGLHEHDRSNVPYMPSREFISWVELFFRKPNERVLGKESAAEALSRFSGAVDAVLREHPAGNLALIAHGTVIALFLAARCRIDAFANWRRMGLPSFVVIEEPDWRIVETEEQV